MSKINELKNSLDDFSDSTYFYECEHLKDDYGATDKMIEEYEEKISSQTSFMSKYQKYKLDFEQSSNEGLWFVSFNGVTLGSDTVESVLEELELTGKEQEKWLKQLINILEEILPKIKSICSKAMNEIVQKYSLSEEEEDTIKNDLKIRFNKLADDDSFYYAEGLYDYYGATDEMVEEFNKVVNERVEPLLVGCDELGISLEEYGSAYGSYIGLGGCNLDFDTIDEAIEELGVENVIKWLEKVVKKLETLIPEVRKVFEEAQNEIVQKYGLVEEDRAEV